MWEVSRVADGFFEGCADGVQSRACVDGTDEFSVDREEVRGDGDLLRGSAVVASALFRL